MSLRLIEVIVPVDRRDEVLDVVRDGHEQQILDIWTDERDDCAAIRILVRSSRTERLTDDISEKFDGVEGFRLMLLAVEATVPIPEKTEDEEQPEDNGENQDGQEAWDRISREELYQDIAGDSQLTPVYLVTVALSTVVAAVGLVRGDVAIIIGAMVIAPLLGPNVALALGCTLGDLGLVWRAAKTAASGIILGLLISLAAGAVIGVDPSVPAIADRTEVSWGDVALALAAGTAGALAFTTGLPAAVIGVMVAVALLPPLVVVGLLIGSGEMRLALGALVLLVTNITCINLAGVGTFFAQQIRPRQWWEAKRAKKATITAVILWLVMLGLLLGAIFWLGQSDVAGGPEGGPAEDLEESPADKGEDV